MIDGAARLAGATRAARRGGRTLQTRLVASAALVVAFAVGMVTAAHDAAASSRDTRPVRFIVPYPAGGPTDLSARVYAEKIAGTIGRPVIVENVPGAQGAVAAQKLLQAPADGRTIYLGTLSTQVAYPLVAARRKQKPSFDPRTDFAPVAPLGGTALVIVASTGAPFTTFDALVRALKSQPGRYAYGSDGIGSLTHLGGAYIDQLAGARATHVPYKGTAEFSQALLRGDVQFGVMGAVGADALLRQGAVRALAIAGPRRSAQLPAVPSTAELGHPDVDLNSWFGVFVKAGTPRDAIDAMADAIRRASADPEVVRRLAPAGIDLGLALSPDRFAERVDRDWTRWKKAIDKMKIDPDN